MYFVSTEENQKVLVNCFFRIVQQVIKSSKITNKEIKWDMDPISE
jgi:hypothetical protein